jgi:transcriptional regulator with XRE-family HTH domain
MADITGERIRKLRERRGLTVRKLAEIAGVPVSTLSAVENGKREGQGLTLATARRIAQALGVTVDFLAGAYEGIDESEFEPAGAVLVDA